MKPAVMGSLGFLTQHLLHPDGRQFPMVKLYQFEKISITKFTSACNKYMAGGNYSIGKDCQNNYCLLGILIQKYSQPELQMLDDLFKALQAQGVRIVCLTPT